MNSTDAIAKSTGTRIPNSRAMLINTPSLPSVGRGQGMRLGVQGGRLLCPRARHRAPHPAGRTRPCRTRPCRHCAGGMMKWPSPSRVAAIGPHVRGALGMRRIRLSAETVPRRPRMRAARSHARTRGSCAHRMSPTARWLQPTRSRTHRPSSLALSRAAATSVEATARTLRVSLLARSGSTLHTRVAAASCALRHQDTCRGDSVPRTQPALPARAAHTWPWMPPSLGAVNVPVEGTVCQGQAVVNYY